MSQKCNTAKYRQQRKKELANRNARQQRERIMQAYLFGKVTPAKTPRDTGV